jgi:hypothetical protein
MSVIPSATVRRLSWLALLPLLLAGCETTGSVPADTRLAGDWSLDHAASDDPDAAIAKVINASETKLRRRLAKYGYGPDQGSAPPDQPPGTDNSADAPDYSFDTPGDRYGGLGLVGPDFRGLRVRLRHALVPPDALHLQVDDDEVDIGADQLPPRAYHVGEKLSRFDEYGTAIITPGFSREQFVLKSKYTSHAERIDTYEVTPATGALTLTEQFTDPTVGRIILHSVYRRS